MPSFTLLFCAVLTPTQIACQTQLINVNYSSRTGILIVADLPSSPQDDGPHPGRSYASTIPRHIAHSPS
ncbi:MAG: hypothetical protein H6Q48_5030 [Deltaproteobacteria bacterium]|jgi:hypothetical protein|nr:hypothetical protein [Deltaproteobacteria bacterium]